MAIIGLIVLPGWTLADEAAISAHYAVFDVSRFGAVRYQWFVLDRQGQVLDDGYSAHYPPDAEMIDPDILMLNIGAGSASFYRFYGLVNRKVSAAYENVLFSDHDKVLYTDLVGEEWYLILLSIFDDTVYAETKIDLASATGRVESAVLDENGSSVTVTYVSDDNYQEKQISIGLD